MKTRRLLTGLLIAAFVLSASPALEAQSIHFRLGSDGVGLSVNSGHHSHVHYCDDDWEDYYKHARKHYKKHHKHHKTEYKKRKKHHKRHHDNGHHYGKRKIRHIRRSCTAVHTVRGIITRLWFAAHPTCTAFSTDADIAFLCTGKTSRDESYLKVHPGRFQYMRLSAHHA